MKLHQYTQTYIFNYIKDTDRTKAELKQKDKKNINAF